ncbi:MAG: single-stranded DNA-binding protein [Firmicutes bacterium]|nr:single-stranded DNA-binding protein [Bacillota bacterium]
MLNKAILIGRLTKDPELRYTPQGTPVATFTLAVDRQGSNVQGERQTDFLPIVTWNKQAETCAHYLSKGRLVAVEGRIQVRSYDRQDGSRAWVTEIRANRVEFLDRAGSGPAPESAPSFSGRSASAQPQRPEANNAPLPDDAFEPEDETLDFEDDIPF